MSDFNKSIEDMLKDVNLPTDSDIAKETRDIKNGISHTGKKRSNQAKENLRQGVKKRVENGWLEKTRQGSVNGTDQWLQSVREGIKKRSDNEQWKQNVKKIANERKNNPEWIEKTKKSARIRSQTSDWIAKQAESAKKRRKPVMTPKGQFESIALAAEYYQHTPNWIKIRISKEPKEWYYLPKNK